MPTRLRVDLAGYHHVINRGVNHCDIFNSDDDKEMFLQIINKSATLHKVTLHDYCLMDNHYHLLIETQKENLSTFMRIVNANYAKYFNKSINAADTSGKIDINQNMLCLKIIFIHSFDT